MFKSPDENNSSKIIQKTDEEKGENLVIDKKDEEIMKPVINLYENLKSDKIDVDRLEECMKNLTSYVDSSQMYMHSLLNPEKNKSSKIPSSIPNPTASFQLHNTFTLSTNSSGNLAVLFNPFFLYDEAIHGTVHFAADKFFNVNFLSTLCYCNSNLLTGSSELTSDWDFNPLNIGQSIPSVYDQYRLVSASIIVKYIGRLDIASGVIGGAIINNQYKEVPSDTTLGTSPSTLTTHSKLLPLDIKKYGNFDLAIDSYYH